MKIKMTESSPKFTFGEETGIKSFYSDFSLGLKRYDPTVALFSYGPNKVHIWPNGDNTGIHVSIQTYRENQIATPDMDFVVKYTTGGNDKDKISTVLCTIYDILDERNNIIQNFKDLEVIKE